MENNLRMLREGAGLSRRKLAEILKTSPESIRRVERTEYAADIELATAICRALGEPLDAAFPGATAILAELEHQGTSQSEQLQKLREVGLEGDTRRHTLKILLRGRTKPMFFDLHPAEADRLFASVQNETNDPSEASFILFDTDELRVAVNLRAMMFSQFLWGLSMDVAVKRRGEDDDDESPTQAVQVYFHGDQLPIAVGVESEQPSDLDGERNYLNDIFAALDGGTVQQHERVHIVDEDGESVFLRVGDISLLTCPLWVVEPDERDGVEDEDGDNEPPHEPTVEGRRTHRQGTERMTLVTVPRKEPRPV